MGNDPQSLYPASEWHDDDGTVLWWHIPVCEPPYVGHGLGAGEKRRDGTPTDCARMIESGWITHWSRIPRVWEPSLEYRAIEPLKGLQNVGERVPCDNDPGKDRRGCRKAALRDDRARG